MGRERATEEVPELWAARQPAELGGRPVSVPASGDLLLTIVVHGLTSVPGASSRWAADATMLMRHQSIDWNRFVELAQRYRVVCAARSAMRYLVDTVDADVPDDAMWELWAAPTSSGERRRFDTLTAADGAVGWGRTSEARGRWVRLRTAVGPTRSLAAAPRFTADILGVDRTWQVPRDVLRRANRKWLSRGEAS